jgi:ribosome maturation factor RimP
MDLSDAAIAVLEPLGFEVLELNVTRQGSRRGILLRIDRLDEQLVSVTDVSTASEAFGLELDRIDPFQETYRLEVESPGPKRPLVRLRHFERFSELAAKFRVSGQSHRGTIRNVNGDRITFDIGEESKELKLDDIEGARLDEWPELPR